MIDAPAALHHVTPRGIERREIFFGEGDDDDFLGRLGKIVAESGTLCSLCYGPALVSNYFDLWFKTSRGTVATGMRRLVGGYAAATGGTTAGGPMFQNRRDDMIVKIEGLRRE